ncbi:MAG: hypothetical protein ACI4PJ_03210, partial [Acutalibacteraceae bacterium]
LFKDLQPDHEDWKRLLCIIERRLDPGHYELYLNAKRKSDESGEPFTFDDDLHNELLCYGFTKDEIKIVDKLLSESRDLYLKEKKDISDAKPEFLKCLQDIISDKRVNTSYAIYEAFKTRTQQFKDLQPGHAPWQRLLCSIEHFLESSGHEFYLGVKRAFEESEEPFTRDEYLHLHSEFLCYGFTENEIKIVDELLNKASDLYLKEKKAILDAKPEFLDYLQSIISDENINTSSAIYEAFETRIQQFRDLQPGHAPWQSLLCTIEHYLESRNHEFYLNSKRESEKSGEPFNRDGFLQRGFLSYGFTEDEIEIVDKLLSKSSDLYLKEKKAILLNKKPKFLECLKGIISDENINTSSAIYEAFETRIQQFRDLQPGHAPWQDLLCSIEHFLEPKAHEYYLYAKRKSEESGEPLNYDEYLNSKFLSYGFTEDEIKIVDELLNKARDLYLKEESDNREERKRLHEEAVKRDAEARRFIVDCIQELLATENITSKSILDHLQAIAQNGETAPLRAELKYVCENFYKISNFWEEGSLGKITGDAFKELKALWEKYRKIQAEEKAKKEAEEKARKEAEEKAKKEAEEKAKKEAEEKARKKAKAGQELAWRLKNFERNTNTPLAKFREVVDAICLKLNSEYPTFWMELSTLQSWLRDYRLDSSDDFDFELYFGFNSDLCGAVKKFVGEAKARRNTERRKEIQKRADRSINEKKAARRGKKGGGRK